MLSLLCWLLLAYGPDAPRERGLCQRPFYKDVWDDPSLRSLRPAYRNLEIVRELWPEGALLAGGTWIPTQKVKRIPGINVIVSPDIVHNQGGVVREPVRGERETPLPEKLNIVPRVMGEKGYPDVPITYPPDQGQRFRGSDPATRGHNTSYTQPSYEELKGELSVERFRNQELQKEKDKVIWQRNVVGIVIVLLILLFLLVTWWSTPQKQRPPNGNTPVD
jgi:hypothetical protein